MNDILLNKLPPQDLDAEESVLSAIFINNKGLEYIGSLTPGNFYKGAHQKIFNAILSLKRKKEPADLVTVAQELERLGELESIGGAAYLYAISEAAPIAVNVGSYSKIIQDLAKARELISISSEIIEDGFRVKDIESYIRESQNKILQVQTTTSKDKFYTMDVLMNDNLERITSAMDSKLETGLNFGMPSLDPIMNISGSKLILLAARPGMGKTAMALSIARSLGYQEKKTGILEIEMDKESLSDRLLSIESNVNSLCFYAKGSLNKKAMGAITNAADNLSSLPILIDDSDCKIQDVERKCRKLKQIGCDLIIIDQLSKIRGVPGQSKFETYTDNCSTIALLKKELRIPIILLCQLNRELEKRNDKTPIMSDLKQTGMLEEDADMIFFIHRPGYYDESIDQSRTDIVLAKNRNGALGKEQQVTFNQKRGMFNLK